jgi:hypothetical protein
VKNTTKGLLIAIALAPGCVSDQAYRYYGKQRYPSTAVEKVEVLSAAPAREFEPIADLQARMATRQQFQKLAAQIGADAVIVTPVGGYASWNQTWAGVDPHSNSYTHLIGTAIKYKNP